MSSRQEEKERRRAERLAHEQAAQSASARRRRLGVVGGVALGLAAVAVLVVVVSSGGGDEPGSAKGGADGGRKIPNVALPAQQVSDLEEAVKAAGCDLRHHKSEGREHSDDPDDWKYKTKPPTSGKHDPQWAADGIYSPEKTPSVGEVVHALEHGRINLQYERGTADRVIGQLQTLVEEQNGYHVLLFQNQTQMPYAVAATAWTQSLGCETVNGKTWDALRAFRARYVAQGPETTP